MFYTRLFILFLMVSIGFIGVLQAKKTPRINKILKEKVDTKKIKRHIRKVMQKIPTSPGIVVAIVKGDKIVFAEGFGYRNLEKKLPVNAQTQFYLASTTKSFTAAIAKMLAEEGKLDLDVPIKTYFPKLKLKAPLSEEQITLRDFLTHSAGITSQALGIRTSYTGQYDADIALKMLAEYSRPVSPAYRYTNLGYVMTGLAVEKVTNESWQKVTRDKIFTPLGMKNTTSYASKAKASGNFAIGYRSENGKFIKLPYKNDATMHAAGGTVSSVEDLAKWLIVMMNNGKFKGKQIISSKAMKEILSPQINQNRTFYKYHRYSYGLGWNIATYKGEEFIHCFGTYAGFRPHVSFMPEHNIGVVVLVNESSESIVLPDLIANEIYDYLLDKRDLNANSNPDIEEYVGRIEQARKRRSSRAKTNKTVKIKSPNFPLNKYAGTYKSDEFGEVEISVKENALFAQMGNLFAKLVHENADSFQADFLVFRRLLKLKFNSNDEDEIKELIFDGDKYLKMK